MSDVMSVALAGLDSFSLATLFMDEIEKIRPHEEEEKTIGKYLAYAASEALFFFGAVIGTIETLFWTTLALLAKSVHVFLSNETMTLICGDLFGRVIKSSMSTAVLGVGFVFNLFDTDEKFKNRLSTTWKTVAEGFHACSSLINYQFFGKSDPLPDDLKIGDNK